MHRGRAIFLSGRALFSHHAEAQRHGDFLPLKAYGRRLQPPHHCMATACGNLKYTYVPLIVAVLSSPLTDIMHTAEYPIFFMLFYNYLNNTDFALDFFLHGAIICTYFNDVYIHRCNKTTTAQ